MSKIFEALRKTEGEAAGLALSAIEGESAAPGTVPPQAPGMALPPPPPHAEPNGQPAANPSSGIRIEAVRLPENSPLLPFDGSDARAAEQYRIIRTKLFHHPNQPRAILVSSPMPGDGKTITAMNLAGALALQEQTRVLVVDCDFRRSSLTKLLGLHQVPGLGEVLRGEATLEQALVCVKQFPNLYVMAPGNAVKNPSELLSSAAWHGLRETLVQNFRFVVFDAPPVGAVADYELVQLACDGVVLVMRPDHTHRHLLHKALENVPKEKQIGIILNCVQDWFLWKTHAYYYYAQ